MAVSRELIVDTVRGRVLRGLQVGTLEPGDRLPASRDLATEFDVDYRLVIAAYKALAEEGLVELRPRGGIYVAAAGAPQGGIPPLPERWLAEVLVEGLAREIPGPELHEWLRRVVETLRLRAVAITTTYYVDPTPIEEITGAVITSRRYPSTELPCRRPERTACTCLSRVPLAS